MSANFGDGRCRHGAEALPSGQVNRYNSVHLEMKLLAKSSSVKTLSRKEQRKIMTRLEKSLVGLSNNKNLEDGLARTVSLHYAYATDFLLKGEMEVSKQYCISAINLQGLCWKTRSANIGHASLCSVRDNLLTNQGLVVFLAKKIPCICLHNYKKAAKKKAKLGTCAGCDEVLPVSALFRCSGCKVLSYCSNACQLQAWKYHKQDCSKWKKEIESENKGKKINGSTK